MAKAASFKIMKAEEKKDIDCIQIRDTNGRSIVKQGWLQIRGEYIRIWRDRYFILFDNGDLFGFKEQPKGNDYQGRQHKFTVRNSLALVENNARRYIFSIRDQRFNRVVGRFFCVDDKQERDDWMKAIRYVTWQLDRISYRTL